MLYAKCFFQLDFERQKCYLLIIDEVYVKSISQYHGSVLFGKVVNKPSKLINTVLSFMLTRFSGGPKFLFKQTDIIIQGVNQKS